MRRLELEHAVRVATEIVEQDRVIIIGSQSILGSFSDKQLPPETTMSEEVDIAPLHDDDAESLATRLDAAVGELSSFHQRHGFYIQGVGRKTAVLPTGWEDRLVPVSSEWTNGGVGLCLDPVDLCVAKLAAQREKDFRFVAALLGADLVQAGDIATRTDLLPGSVDARTPRAIHRWIDAWVQAHGDGQTNK